MSGKQKDSTPDSRLKKEQAKLFDPKTFLVNHEIFKFPYLTGKTNPVPVDCYENFTHLMDYIGIKMRYNKMTRLCEASMPHHDFFNDEKANLEVMVIANIMRINGMKDKFVGDYMLMHGCQDVYHPVLEAIEAKPWDGVRRLDKFIATIKATNSDVAPKLIRLWMMQCIEALLTDLGYITQGVLILQGEPFTGKTEWFKRLSISTGSVRTEMEFDVSQKDDRISAASFWINEMAEVDGLLKRRESSSLKSYFTSQSDLIRCPYARKNSNFARRSVFGGTTNNSTFLYDPTGNRGYWVVQVEKIDWHHGLDMQQVWAEMYACVKGGETVVISPELLAEISTNNKSFDEIDPLEEMLTTKLDWSNSARVDKTATEIATALLGRIPKDKEARKIGGVLCGKRWSKVVSNRLLQGIRRYSVPQFMYRDPNLCSCKW